ncbi:MAG: hypothetical protein VB959_02190 [Rhodospirillales bacterium]|jgi:hypothetical protein
MKKLLTVMMVAFLAVAAGPALADCGGNHEASEDTKKEKSSGV